MTAFEFLQKELGCVYISDLQSNIRTFECDKRMKQYLMSLDYTPFALKELMELYEYLFGEEIGFCSYIEAERHFHSKAAA